MSNYYDIINELTKIKKRPDSLKLDIEKRLGDLERIFYLRNTDWFDLPVHLKLGNGNLEWVYTVPTGVEFPVEAIKEKEDKYKIYLTDMVFKTKSDRAAQNETVVQELSKVTYDTLFSKIKLRKKVPTLGNEAKDKDLLNIMYIWGVTKARVEDDYQNWVEYYKEHYGIELTDINAKMVSLLVRLNFLYIDGEAKQYLYVKDGYTSELFDAVQQMLYVIAYTLDSLCNALQDTFKKKHLVWKKKPVFFDKFPKDVLTIEKNSKGTYDVTYLNDKGKYTTVEKDFPNYEYISELEDTEIDYLQESEFEKLELHFDWETD